MKQLLFLFIAMLLTACDNVDTAQSESLRGYSTRTIANGKQVFDDDCQICHGVNGEGGSKQWQKRDANGDFPAPPLNGTAHTWHHNLQSLLGTIDRGGIPLGGTMPSFKDKLSQDDKDAVLAYVINLWPDKVYEVWAKMNTSN